MQFSKTHKQITAKSEELNKSKFKKKKQVTKSSKIVCFNTTAKTDKM